MQQSPAYRFHAESIEPKLKIDYNRGQPGPPPVVHPKQTENKPRVTVPVILFLLTLLTTLFAGSNYNLTSFLPENSVSIYGGGGQSVDLLNLDFWKQILRSPSLLRYGISFSLPLMLILGAHEMGHYLACRRYRIRATLPHFLPAPTLIGTFGAFIRIRSPIPHRRALFDVGVAGPLAGFIMTIPLLVWGISLSPPQWIEAEPGYWVILFGEPMTFQLISHLIHGPLHPGMVLDYHPMAFAAWFGLLLTAFNLFPVSQLDGGHIGYALFGRPFATISRGVFVLILLMGIVYPGWLVWALIIFFLGFRHPPTIDDNRRPGGFRFLIGILTLIVFVLCFTPTPFQFISVQ